MTDPARARDRILAGIRKSLGRGQPDARSLADIEDRITRHPRNLIPGRADLPPAGRVDLFVRMATEVAATVDRIPDVTQVPKAVAEFLIAHNLPASVRIAPDPRMQAIAWADRPTLSVAFGKAAAADATSVTGAVAGVAETGTLALASGPEHPTTLNLMPDTHIVILWADQIVGSYEDAWDTIRARASVEGSLPRTVNFVTGPSRTGDIEQTIQLGAHGPRRLHIVIVDVPETAA